MSFIKDMQSAKRRFPQHVAAFVDLFRRHNIHSMNSFRQRVTNATFRREFKTLALKVAEVDGGKVSTPLLMAIVGSALGGVGIAMMGGAFGLPLAAICAICGVLLGNEADSTGATKRAISYVRSKF